MVKAKIALKDKDQAIEKRIEENNQESLKADFVEKVNKIMKKKIIKVDSIQNLRNRYINKS